MQYDFDLSKYQYIRVLAVVDNISSDIESLGLDGWEPIYFLNSIIRGTQYVFRRPKNKEERKKWESRKFLGDFSETDWILVVSKGGKLYKKTVS